MEPPFNEPLYNEIQGITNYLLQPGQNYNKMYGTEPPHDEPQSTEILVTTNTTLKHERKIYMYM